MQFAWHMTPDTLRRFAHLNQTLQLVLLLLQLRWRVQEINVEVQHLQNREESILHKRRLSIVSILNLFIVCDFQLWLLRKDAAQCSCAPLSAVGSLDVLRQRAERDRTRHCHRPLCRHHTFHTRQRRGATLHLVRCTSFWSL